MAKADISPSFLFRQPAGRPSGAAHDFRLLIDAVQSDDLTAARTAYGRLMERLSGVGTGSDDALTRIGASLRGGDLTTVRRTLDGLESRALRVLRGLRADIDLVSAHSQRHAPHNKK